MAHALWTGEHRCRTLQASALLIFGLLFLLGAIFFPVQPLKVPVGLFCFGLGILLSTVFNPSRLVIAGVLFTLIGAAIFLAYKPILPYDNALVVIAVGMALCILSFLTRRGYVGAGAITPGLVVLLVGLLLYPPTGGTASRFLAPFLLSLWFPGILLLLLGVIYGILSLRQGRGERQ